MVPHNCGTMSRKKVTAAVTPSAQADILTDAQCAQLLAVKSRTLRLWRRTRGLPHLRITNREIRYRRSDIDQWLNHRRVAIAA
jgi:predicted DNA-binding transcriptional regulator AlpA